jgi:putative Mg2+ transporter-C (MgtC) family protein
MPSYLELILRLVLATFLAGIIGFQRAKTQHTAGPRTYALVAIGSCLFTILSMYAFGDSSNIDKSRVAAQILVGVGFLGAGIIMHKGSTILGLTTAAGVWGVAAIGMAIGAGQYLLGVAAAILVLLVLLINDDRWTGASSG